MKSKIYTIAMLAFAFTSYDAQVGINTTDPSATLDVIAKASTGTSTNVDGLLIPRVERQRAASMANIPISTLIYVNEVTTGDLTGTTQDVDIVGYYFFNGTKWQKLSPAPIAQTDDWHLVGNMGITNVTSGLSTIITAGNYIGTADDKILSFGVNKKLSGQMYNDGSFIGGGSATGATSNPLKARFSWGDNNVINTSVTGVSMILGSLNTTKATDFNLALGKSNSTSGSVAYVMGDSNDVYNGSAYGYYNTVSGTSSIAIGNANRIGPYATGATSGKFYYNFTYGDGNTIENNADTYYNTLLGRANGMEVAGSNNTILGFTNRIKSSPSLSGVFDNNVFLSSNANISGSNNSGLGQQINLSGNKNIAIGNNVNATTVSGDNNVLIGYGTIGVETRRANGVYAIGADTKTNSTGSMGTDQYIFGKKLGISSFSNTLSLGFNLSATSVFLAPDVNNGNFYYNINHIFRNGGDAGTKTKIFVNPTTSNVTSDLSAGDIIVPQGIRYLPVSSQPTCNTDNLGLVIFYSGSNGTDKMQVCGRVSGTFGWRDLN